MSERLSKTVSVSESKRVSGSESEIEGEHLRAQSAAPATKPAL